MQREGYAQAIVSNEFLQALKTGPNRKMAVTYFEWSASSDQKIIIPWRLIDGPEAADTVAAEIMKTPVRRGSRTSISGAINFAMPLFDENPYQGLRRVIDISGDGPNNNGVTVAGARAAALEKGITINGLPIMAKEPSHATMDIDDLDLYYEDCVIGGPSSFVMAINDREKFKEAIRTKLILEVAGRTPERRIVPAAEKEPRVPCLIGEKIPLGAVTNGLTEPIRTNSSNASTSEAHVISCLGNSCAPSQAILHSVCSRWGLWDWSSGRVDSCRLCRLCHWRSSQVADRLDATAERGSGVLLYFDRSDGARDRNYSEPDRSHQGLY